MHKPHSNHLRRGRYSEPGRAYLLTTVTKDRQPLFADLTLARHAIHCLRTCDRNNESQTLAFVLMPDHLHWLIILQHPDLSAPMRRFKSLSAKSINRIKGTPGRTIWQPGFHDHALRRDEDMRQIARYIIANPMRAGLVESPGQYSHWDAIWL
jgi:putative transposase